MNSIQRSREGDSEIPLEPRESKLRDIFSKLDHNGDGRIDIDELSEELNRHYVFVPVPKIQKMKSTGNSFITYDEFVKLMSSGRSKNYFQKVLLQYMKHVIPPSTRRSLDLTDGEYEDQYTCEPPAICMLLVSIVEISLFCYDLLLRGYSFNGPTAMLLIYNPYRRVEIWRFFSYMFVHVGTFHLVVNVVVQILLGVPLEMVHGWWRVLIVYISGVVAGSLSTSITDPKVYLAGASGGVYAIITAHVASIIMNWSEMQFAFFQLLVFLFLTITDVGSAIYNRYMNVDDKIGYTAHLAGGLSGLLVGLYILRNLEVHSWEKKISIISVIMFVLVIVGCIVFNIFYPDYFPKQEL